MTTIRRPIVSMTITSADNEIKNTPQKLLVVGQFADTDASPTATAGVLHKNVSESTMVGLFGLRGSLPHMLRAMKRIAPGVQIDAIPIGDGTTAATKTITFASGPAAAAAQITVIVGSEKEHEYILDVSSAADVTAIAAALEVLIDADAACPFTAGAAAGVLTLTAEDKGTVAQTYTVRVEGDIPGVTITIANAVSGASDPAAVAGGAILDVIGETRYQNIIWPWSDFSEPLSLVNTRFNVANKIQDGELWVGEVKSHADLLTALGSENSASQMFLSSKLEDSASIQGGAIPELPEVQNAMMATIVALRLTQDAAVAQYVVTNSPLDQFGGTHMNSLPLFNTVLPDLGLPAVGAGFTDVEIDQLEAAGGWVLGANSARSGMIAGSLVTTYLTKGDGTDDLTFRFLNYVITASAFREFIVENARSRFAQSRLTQGLAPGGHDFANKIIIRGFMMEKYEAAAGVGMVLVQDGPEAFEFFDENLTIDLEISTGKATVTMQVPIVTQLRNLQITAQISFDITL